MTVGPDTQSFSVKGVRNGSPVVITWDRGTLAGDPPTLDLIEVQAELSEVSKGDPIQQRRAAPAAPGSDVSHPLARADTAYAVIEEVLQLVSKVTVT